jgi:ABC-2 type transport system ATP-binding protein
MSHSRTSRFAVSVRNLHKHYGALPAVQGVSFEVAEGEVFGLLGRNGAGKTTTVECMLGLREPDEGDIEICGIDARRRPRDAKRKIGAALQTTSLQDKITPREALALFGALYGVAADPASLLDSFGLTKQADAAIETLSGGERQRLALTLAVVNDPELLILDEPTGGLDPQGRRELHAAIARFKDHRRTVLLTTHLIDEAEQLCDRVAIIDKGHIIATGSPAQLVAESRTMQSVSLVTTTAVARERLAALPDVQDLHCAGERVRFRTARASRTLAALTALLESHGIEIVELHAQKASLEDLFIELTS